MLRGISPFSLLVSLSPFGLVHGLPEVKLGETTIAGLPLPVQGQEHFAGIPYAEPPVGPLRFAPTVLKLDPGVPTLNATQFGIACPQFPEFTTITTPFDTIAFAEDCLTINVLRPDSVDESNSLPVMVWIHGGGFFEGASSVYNGSEIVTRSVVRGTPIIYVGFNYRVGPIGFPQGKEAESLGATNLAHKDVLAALTWVQSNIGAFGGDKDKVTMFGQSAGSIIISQLLLNMTFDLARAAILESGSPNTLPMKHASEREDLWQRFVSGVPECQNASSSSTFGCLRSASLESITNAVNLTLPQAQDLEIIPFAPVIDGQGGLIPDLPSRLFASGEFARLSFISGTTLDEGTLFLPSSFNSSERLRQWLLTNSTPPVVSVAEQAFVIDRILDLYPDNPAVGSPFGTGNETFGLSPEFKRGAAVIGDIMMTAPRRHWVQSTARQGVKVFSYLFTDPHIRTTPAFAGVPHGAEILYVLGIPGNVLSENVLDYWVSFATSLDPNDGRGNASRPLWTQYTPESEDVLQINSDNFTMIPDTFRETQIAFLNAHADAILH